MGETVVGSAVAGVGSAGTRALRTAALCVLGAVAVVVAVGPQIAPYDPLATNTADVLAAPSAAHWLGTDYLGRDILSRLLAGTRLSVLAALEAVVLALVLGSVCALFAVFAPRPVRWVLERVFDSFLALPFITFAVAIGALLGNSIHAAMLAVGLLAAPTYFRVVRAAVLESAHTQYVEAARLFGIPTHRIVRDHIVPRVVPVVLVTSAGVLAGCLLVVASLTFLGVGVQPPVPTWGGMLSSDLAYLALRPWNPVAPALAIMLTVASLGVLADLVRDAGTGRKAPRRRTRGEARQAAAPRAGAGAAPRQRILPAQPIGLPIPEKETDSVVVGKTVAGAGSSHSNATLSNAAPANAALSQNAALSNATLAATSRDTADLVVIDDLHLRSTAGTPLVRGVSLRVPRGSSVGILGESGSGKTLTCRALLGVLPDGVEVAGGRVEFDGSDVLARGRTGSVRTRAARTQAARMQGQALHGRRIGAVFQDPGSYLTPHLRVGPQVTEALRTVHGLGRRAAKERALELFTHVGLRNPAEVYRSYPHALSGGMLQRILLAIAVSGNPDLLIADEATTALDVTVQAEVLALLGRLRSEHDLTVLMISHDLAVLARNCDHLYVFRDGEVVESGPTAEVVHRPQHPYTQMLLRDHAHYGLEAVRGGAEATDPVDVGTPEGGEPGEEQRLPRIHPGQPNPLPFREKETESVALGESVASAPEETVAEVAVSLAGGDSRG